jgi:hypothetical protein
MKRRLLSSVHVLVALVLACMLVTDGAWGQAAVQTAVPVQLKIVTGGLSITSSGGAVDFGTVNVASTGQTVTASSVMSLTLSDASGAARGWSLTLQASDLSDGTGVIPATPNLRINPTGGTITALGGQAIDATNGPRETSQGTQPLGSPVRILFANPGYGVGTYRYTPGPNSLTLTVPQGLRVGTGNFSGTLTATILTGP